MKKKEKQLEMQIMGNFMEENKKLKESERKAIEVNSLRPTLAVKSEVEFCKATSAFSKIAPCNLYASRGEGRVVGTSNNSLYAD